MSHVYRAVGWSPQKRKYDLVVALCVAVYSGAFAAVTLATQPHVTVETVLLRATGSLAFLMLSFVLLVGPLARLSPRFLPVLYNRRHLGVATFLVALVHGFFAVFQFHFLGDLNPFASVLSSDGSFGGGDGGVGVPFQPLGAIVLAVLFVMAATSHDFWLANLTPRVWKGLHMAVYAAYAVLLGHIVLGALQGEGKAYLWPMIAAVAGAVFALHLYTGLAERRRDRAGGGVGSAPDGYVRAVAVSEIPDLEGRVVALGDERVAVFRNGSVISCVSNVCRHQMGADRRGADHRRLHHLSLARVPVRPRDGVRAAALRRQAGDLRCRGAGRVRVGESGRQPPGHGFADGAAAGGVGLGSGADR